jgi:PhnB protein
MARVNTYLNFQGNTEEAFNFYAQVFQSSFTSLTRMKDMGVPGISEADGEKIMNVQLPIIGGHVLMATDFLESLGHQLRVGNNCTISLDVDSKDEADRLYSQLSIDSTEFSAMADMPWGAYWGSTLDRFGVRWMISYAVVQN